MKGLFFIIFSVFLKSLINHKIKDTYPMLHKQETNNYNNILWPKLNYVIVTSCVIFTNVFILCQSLGGGKITSQRFKITLSHFFCHRPLVFHIAYLVVVLPL